MTKMMRPMYAIFSKQMVLTGNIPNEPSHMFPIAEFRDWFQLQKLLFHGYSCYLMATKISFAQVNKINLNSSLARCSSWKMPVKWRHDLLFPLDLVSYQIPLVYHCIIEWALIRIDWQFTELFEGQTLLRGGSSYNNSSCFWVFTGVSGTCRVYIGKLDLAA
jgi:hypothetical protein